MHASCDRSHRWRRYWDSYAPTYDREMRFWDRVLFRDSRAWACSQATGNVLEVAVGTGLNLAVYPADVTLTGVDLSKPMLSIARTRAAQLGRVATLLLGDAHALAFDDGMFDTVVCTCGLCAIPDIDAAINEMRRVLRPGGRLILVDHIASSVRVFRGVQRLIELYTVPRGGEHLRRRPLKNVAAAGFEIERVERFNFGHVERLVARKPTDA